MRRQGLHGSAVNPEITSEGVRIGFRRKESCQIQISDHDSLKSD